MDFRTEGSRGTNETDGFVERREGEVSGADGFISGGLDDAPMPELPMAGANAPGLEDSKDHLSACKLGG